MVCKLYPAPSTENFKCLEEKFNDMTGFMFVRLVSVYEDRSMSTTTQCRSRSKRGERIKTSELNFLSISSRVNFVGS